MSHVDTAFKLGSLQAQHDFQAELQKLGYGGGVIPEGPAQAPPGVARGTQGGMTFGTTPSNVAAAPRPNLAPTGVSENTIQSLGGRPAASVSQSGMGFGNMASRLRGPGAA